MINYRYNIIEKLGEGGSGEVFRAEDVALGGPHVALKVLHSSEKIGPEAEEAFRNEMTALVGLSHPNLIRVFDSGIVRSADDRLLERRRFFTMEFMQGTNATVWLSLTPDQRERESVLDVLLLQALSVLSYIHHEGIVHYDIKPDNFVLLGDKKAPPLLKLTDFGFSRQRNEGAEISLRGTLEYTAPELLGGSEPDHRADLYSLGATFFHLLTGTCPFEAATPVELVKRVLTEEADVMSGGNDSLRTVIKTLLRKNPRERYGNAEEAARALAAGRPDGDEILESYFGRLRKPRFVGRDRETLAIGQNLDRLAKGDSPSVPAMLINGIEGIGKTALLESAKKHARSRELFVAAADAVHRDIPFSMVGVIVRLIACEIRSVSDVGRAVFEKFDGILGLSLQDSAQPSIEWGQEKEKYSELVARFLLESSSVVPFVIVVDDLQFADEASRAVLQVLIRDAQEALLFVLAAETGEGTGGLSSAAHMHLSGLEQHDVRTMCESIFGSGEPAVKIGSGIHELYGGTPGVVVEALRALNDILSPDILGDPARSAEIAANLEHQLPLTFDDFVLARFKKLRRERQVIISLLSCFQHPAPTAAVMSVLPFTKQRFADQLRYLELDGFTAATPGETHISLRMKRLKDVVYDSIRSERKELHTLIAAHLESMGGEPSFERLQELAYQFSQCDNSNNASKYGEQAGDRGMQMFAFKRALELYDAAIAASVAAENTPRIAALKAKYADGLFRAGMYSEAVNYARESIREGSQEERQQQEMTKILGLSLSRLGEVEDAQKYLTKALHASGSEPERLELKQELVGLDVAAGRYKEAEEMCREQLANALQLNNKRLMSAVYTDLGIAVFLQDRFDEAAHSFAKALELYHSLNDKSHVADAMNNIGNALSAKGDYAHAIEQWQSALQESQQFGTLIQQAQIHNNLGIAYFNLRQYRQAKDFFRESRRMNERLGSRIGLANALANMGEVMFAEGEYEPALQQWSEAFRVYEALDNAYGSAECTLHLAQVLQRIGDYDEAKLRLAKAKSLITEHKLETFQARYDFLAGELLLSRKDFLAAEQSYASALQNAGGNAKRELSLRCRVRIAECLRERGESREAVETLGSLLSDETTQSLPGVFAEIQYLLGAIATEYPALMPEKPITYFKQGIEAIAKEPVSEISWRLTYAVALEYHRRGQVSRAREFFVKTRLILQFFLSHFSTAQRKDMYECVDMKDRVLSTVDRLLKS